MMKKKINYNRIKYCLLVSVLFIVSGCASQDKQDKIMKVQKRRIVSLERELDQKQKLISELKASRWAKEPVKKSTKLALRPMIAEIKNKNWVKALKISSELKKSYPNNLTLARYRYSIFKKMGLDKHAKQEKIRYKKLLSVTNKGKTVR